MSLEQALAVVQAAGYRVTKPRAPKAKARMFNAVGKPFSPSYDPNYRMKHKVSTAHLFKPYGSDMRLTPWTFTVAGQA
jgi:hypothetical protein